jgi:ketosteroid isomerase-like protein
MWFTETPWPPIFICSVIAVILFAAWYATQRGIHLVGIAGLVLIGVVIYFVEASIVTKAERVEAAVIALAEAYQQGNLDASLEHISPDYVLLRGAVETTMAAYEVSDDLRLTDLSVRFTADDTKAISHFRANATISGPGVAGQTRRPTRWELIWQLEANTWKVIKARSLDPLTGEENPLLASLLR